MSLSGTSRGQGTHNSATLTFTLSPASNFAAGLAALVIAADNSGTGGSAENFTSVTDTIGNTWVERQTCIFDNGAAHAGVQGAFYTTNQAVGLLTTGTTITVTLANTTTAKAWALMEVVGSVGTPTFLNGGTGTGATTNAPTVTSGSITNTNMIIGGLFNEQGTGQAVTQDADATNGTWSTQQTAEVGSTTSGMTVSSQRKVVTATATQTFNPTLAVSSDTICGWIQIEEIGFITGSTTLTATPTGSIEGEGALAGSSAATFTTSGSVVGDGTLAGSLIITFSPTGTLQGDVDIIGSTTLTFTGSGDIQGILETSGTTNVTFSVTGDIDGLVAASGSSSVTFSPTGSLEGTANADGTSTLVFTGVGQMEGSGELSGAGNVSFTTSGDIEGSGEIIGQSNLQFSTTSDLTGEANLAGTSQVDFSLSGSLDGLGDLQGLSSLDFSLSGTLTTIAAGAITGVSNLSFSLSGTLTGESNIKAIPSIIQIVFLGSSRTSSRAKKSIITNVHL